MLKSYVKTLTSVYLGILEDVKYAFPAMGPDLVKDQRRLLTLVENRGLPFLMVDLPNLGKHLDRCLAKGHYSSSGLPASKPISASVGIPVLFRGLYLMLFDEQGNLLKEELNGEALFFLRQLLLGAKRAKIMCSETAINQAIDSFGAVDGLLPAPHPFWDDMSASVREETTFLGFAKDALYTDRADQAQVKHTSLETLDKVFSVLVHALGEYDSSEWGFSHGHGSVSNMPSEANRYHFREWPEMLETEFPFADVAYHSYSAWADSMVGNDFVEARPSGNAPQLTEVGSFHSPSKLMAVAKTLTKPRLIASEPAESMFCQQNIRRYMYSRVRKTWIGDFIKFDDQSQNQELCLAGSRDGSLATLDLSEASDRVTCQCVGNVFRGNHPLLRALRATRTPHCEVRGTIVKLNKFSTMGNATTFPVQSLIFLGIAIAGCLGAGGVVTPQRIKRLRGKVSVFGDDIIVPTERVGAVIELLECLHFKVNVAKSYAEGNFRESCGVDAYKGTNVTPVYWRTLFDGSPESYDATVATSNNFYKRFLVVTSQVVRTSIQAGGGRIRFPLVPMDSRVVGFHSFVKPDTDAPKRWNEGLQREEFRLPCFTMKQEVVKSHDDSAMLQFFTELPDPLTKWESGIRCREVLKIKHDWVSASTVGTTSLDG